ncbi:MAG TPA: S8 family serine peptidase [Chitinophagaceae bacterium]|nr:S8 family serine peptidase [Chitinophagaceae bacterium]
MKKLLPVFILLLTAASASQAQLTRYIVKLKNKGGSSFSFSTPINYLSQRAIDRRTRYSIAIDSTDLPVTPSYVTQIRNVPNVTMLNISKWLNSVTIQTSSATAINTINGLSFVQSVNGIASRTPDNGGTTPGKFDPASYERIEITNDPPPSQTARIAADYFNYGTSSYDEIHLHNGEFLHNIGLRGQTMQIAILDNGFNNYTAFDAFDSVNINGQVLGTWDFVAREQNVANDGSHGMSCFSTIAANIPGQFIGKAPKASFWLFQTEDNSSEYPIEEFNWVCGAERSDSSGADVLTSSLAYSDFDNASLNHTYADMNGNTTIASTGADLAAKKGMIIFNAIGNTGTSAWHFLCTPSDGDSVVAIGAVNSSGTVWAGSGYGPSSDGQIKPDMASVGLNARIQTSGNTVGPGTGTSFACPNMAGLGTILWQGFPEYNNMKIIRAMQQAGTKFNNPDDRVGYGIPNMKTAFGNLLTEFATSNATVSACNATINWTSKDVQIMKYEIERKVPGESNYSKVGEMNPQAGTLLAIHTYQFNNAITSPTAGTVSYRIRQVIDTAAASFTAVYIDTANVTIASGCFATGTGNPDPDKELVMVQPNPVSGSSVTLVIETGYAVTDMPVAVYDAKGRLMMQLKDAKGTGRKTIELNISRFSKGKYYIKVLNGLKTIGTAELLKL